jgi:4-carboxymuconolactone decarboxylase
MDDATRALVALSAVLGRGDQDAVVAAMDAAAAAAAPGEVEEALLQSYLFLGFPAALNALKLWRRRVGVARPSPASDDWEAWRLRGEAVCQRVYGGQYPRLRENIAALHPDLERWMIAEGYGKVLGRPGLDLWRRELCVIGLLAGQDAAPQLYAHMRGALNVGASEADVAEALDVAGIGLDAEQQAVMRRTWDHVRRRSVGAGESEVDEARLDVR